MAAEQSQTMATAWEPAPKTFEDLPNDCILLVVNEVAKLPGEGWRQPKNIEHLSLLNKRLRQLCIPALFNFNKVSLTRNSPSVIESFAALSKAQFVVSRLFAVEVHFDDKPKAPYGNAFCASFVTAFSAMASLSQLSLSLGNDEVLIANLRTLFKDSSATFPSIQVLELMNAPNVPFILKACPSLESFIVRSLAKKWKSTFSPLPSMKTLRQFEIDNSENWTARRLQELLPYVVNIPELCIKGELYNARLSSLAKCFTGLTNLNTLSMTSTQWVNVRNLSRYYGDDGLLDQIDDQQATHYRNENAVTVAQAFFIACPSLVIFRPLFAFEGIRYICERHEAGASQGKLKDIRVCEEDKGQYWYGFPTKFNPFNRDD